MHHHVRGLEKDIRIYTYTILHYGIPNSYSKHGRNILTYNGQTRIKRLGVFFFIFIYFHDYSKPYRQNVPSAEKRLCNHACLEFLTINAFCVLNDIIVQKFAPNILFIYDDFYNKLFNCLVNVDMWCSMTKHSRLYFEFS